DYSIVVNKEIGEYSNSMEYIIESNKIYHKTKFNFKPTKMLIPTLKNQKNYLCHYRMLQFMIKHGIILKKIHYIVRFDQKDFIRPYIELNTELRKRSKTKFEKNIFKLLNNSLYGKFIQNVFKYVNLKLLLNEKDEKHFKLVNSLLFKRNIIFDSNFEAVEMRKEKALMNMPIRIGFSILELSKLYMFQFYYDILKPYFGNKMSLMMTDTDSFLLYIKCKDIYKELKYLQNKYDCFDFSEFDKNHFMYDDKNHKEIGKMSIEMSNNIITEFVGLKPKMYALKCISPDNINNQSYKRVAKGIKKCNIKKELSFDIYKDVLFNQ